MYEVGCSLEDDGVGQFNASGVADCLDSCRAIRDRIGSAHNGAHRQRGFATYCLEVSEAHGFLPPRAKSGGDEVSLLRVDVGVRFDREGGVVSLEA